MSYFDDELREILECIKNEESASVLEFFTELKRKIDSGFEINSEFNLRLIFADLNIKNSISEFLNSTQFQRIILRSILKNKDKKISIDDFIRSVFESNNQLDIERYIREGEVDSGLGSLLGQRVNMEKTVGVQRGAGPMAMEDDGDRKIRDLKKKYKKFYRKFSVSQKGTNDVFSMIKELYPLIIRGIIGGFLGYYIVSNKNELYQYSENKYEQFVSFKSENFDKYFTDERNENVDDKSINPQTSYNRNGSNDEINYNYTENDFPKKCDDPDVLNIIYQYAENSKKNFCVTVPYFMNLPMSQMFQKCGIGKSNSNVNSNLILKNIVKLEYNKETDFVKCKGVMYADFGKYGMSDSKKITYTIEKTTENLPYVSISPGRLFQPF